MCSHIILCNADTICDNYHPSCAETNPIFLNKITHLVYKISYKLQNCCHRSYIVSPIVHSIYANIDIFKTLGHSDIICSNDSIYCMHYIPNFKIMWLKRKTRISCQFLAFFYFLLLQNSKFM